MLFLHPAIGPKLFWLPPWSASTKSRAVINCIHCSPAQKFVIQLLILLWNLTFSVERETYWGLPVASTVCRGILCTVRPHFVYSQVKDCASGFVWCLARRWLCLALPTRASAFLKCSWTKWIPKSKFLLRAILLCSAEATPWLDGVAEGLDPCSDTAQAYSF